VGENMEKNKIFIVILICLFLLLPINVFADPSYGKVGADTNFNGDVGVPEGSGYYINGVLLSILENVVEDTTPQLGGDLDLNMKNILLDDTLGSDHTYCGIIDVQPVGESVVFGQLLYFNWTDKEWKKAKADAVGTTPALAIALESKGDGQACKLLRQGYIRDDSWDFTGAMVYLSDTTAGGVLSAAPSDTGDQVQRVGQAKTADILFFNPSIDVGEVK